MRRVTVEKWAVAAGANVTGKLCKLITEAGVRTDVCGDNGTG